MIGMVIDEPKVLAEWLRNRQMTGRLMAVAKYMIIALAIAWAFVTFD